MPSQAPTTAALAEFLDIMRSPGRIPSPQMVESLHERYPFFMVPAALMLSRCGDALDQDARRRLANRVALNCSDSGLLFRITGSTAGRLAELYPEPSTPTPDTFDAIDTFLERYGNSDPAEEATLERLIFNPVPADFSASLASDDATGPDRSPDSDTADTMADILSAIRDIKSLSAADDEAEDEEADSETSSQSASDNQASRPAPRPIHSPVADTTFSESLAKIYIKQQRFDKALEIISGLNLKYPEKSVYFADQIRFLQKLILNRSYNPQQ